MRKFIPLASPDIRADDIAAANAVMLSGMLVQGPEVEALENQVKEFLGCSHAIAVSNGTATLHLALVAHGIGPGDEVIVPALSYIATANVVELVGARPVFVDIDLATFNIEPSFIGAAITPKTKAIIPVHEFGLACNMEAIMDIAKKHNLVVIEDAACALGAHQNNKPAGTFGDFGSFSLHPRKAISSGEGGILITENAEKAKRIRTLRNHGIEIQHNKMEFVEPGFNYRMTDFQAAFVRSQLKRLPAILEYKNQLAGLYATLINNPKIILPVRPSNQDHTWQTYHVLLDSSIDRDKVIADLKEKGIGTNYGAQCMPAQKFYQQKYQLNCPALFPNAWTAYTSGLAIPLYEKLTTEDISYIAQQLNNL